MSRPLRIDYPNAWHHVMNRARRGQCLLKDKNDYQMFIDLLIETSELFNVHVAAYCLMPNHYHLLVQTPDANLTRCMRHINGVFTQRYNVVHECDGTLFRGRYKSIVVDADSYLLQLVRYIHKNPIKAGLSKQLNQYSWSSHKGYISKTKKWHWLYKDFVLSMLSPKPDGQIRAYKLFMAQEEEDGLLKVFERKYLPAVLGSTDFMSWIKNIFYEKKLDKQVPASKKLAPDLETIIAQVCRSYGIKRKKLRHVRRGVRNEPRDVAIYLMRTLRAEPLMRIGTVFNLNHYSSVSSAVCRVKASLKKNPALEKRLKEIQADLIKGQTET
jgi:REP element-mobilizing transposase RayT